MGAIIIKADAQSTKILTKLAKRLGGNVVILKSAEIEDLLLGSLMDSVKTNKTISRATIMKKLQRK